MFFWYNGLVTATKPSQTRLVETPLNGAHTDCAGGWQHLAHKLGGDELAPTVFEDQADNLLIQS